MLSSPTSTAQPRARLPRGLWAQTGRVLVSALLLHAGVAAGQSAASLDLRTAPEVMAEAGPSLAELERSADQLKSPDADQRRAAIERLAQLPAHALPALRERLVQLQAFALERSAAIPILEKLIAASDAQSPEGSELDPMPRLHTGAEKVLADDRDAKTRLVVETALLLTSLEALRTTDAGLALAEVMPIAGGAFRAELRRVRIRAGEWLLPALISLRSHEDSHVKRWAQVGVRALGFSDPLMIVELEDPKRLAEAITAYSQPLDFDAMPTLVRLTRHDRLQVREAARAAVARFGKNAIWQVRELYEELSGKRAPRSWGPERTAGELYAVIDRPRVNAAESALSRGLDSLAAGDFERMERDFAIALTKQPDHPQRDKMAEGYSAAGLSALRAGELERAETLLRTAVFLGKRPADQAQLAYVRAQQSLAAGLVDRAAFEDVLALDPAHAGAIAALDRISGRYAAAQREKKRRALFAGAALLLVAAGLALRHSLRRSDDAEAPSGDEAEANA